MKTHLRGRAGGADAAITVEVRRAAQPAGYVAAAFQDAEDMAAEFRVARRVIATRRATPRKGSAGQLWDAWWRLHHGPALTDHDEATGGDRR